MRTFQHVVFTIGLVGALFAIRGEDRLAILKNEQPLDERHARVIVLDTSGKVIAELMDDLRPKNKLRWLPDGGHLSYMVEPKDGAMARLAIIDLRGRILKEVSIRPRTNPPIEVMRFVEDITWITARKIRVQGSVNPRNCEMFDLDIDTGKESNWQVGQCYSFVASPDDKHIAYLTGHPIVPDEELEDAVEMDDERVTYPDRNSSIRVLARPVWCPDSRRVAFIERQKLSGETALTILSVTSDFKKIGLPAHLAEGATIRWINSRIVVQSDRGSVLVDPDNTTMTMVTPDVQPRLEQIVKTEQRTKNFETRVEDIRLKFGAREGVGWRSRESQ